MCKHSVEKTVVVKHCALDLSELREEDGTYSIYGSLLDTSDDSSKIKIAHVML